MTGTVYHLLSETEPFSEFHGGAISRWAANVLRGDGSSAIICPSADDTWNFPPARVIALPRFSQYRKLRRVCVRLPWFVQRRLMPVVLASGMERIRAGDVLWVHNRPNFAFSLAPMIHKAGARIVLHMHNSHLLEQSEARIRESRIDHFVFVSSYLQRESVDRFPFITNSTVLYNGADETVFYPPATDRAAREVPHILFASRLVKEKGAHIFLEAMRLLDRAGVKAKGIMVGASHFGHSKVTPYIGELHAMAPANVEFRPYCSGKELADMFRDSDIFCAPSIWDEPFGMVNVEAFASALPVVSTHGGGSAEVFAYGGGLLVERGSAEKVAEALKTLIASPQLRMEIGRAGIASFKNHYTWDFARLGYRNILKSMALV